MTRRRILSITTSPLPYEGQITDGPGYRMWNLMREIARHHDVRILSLFESFHERRSGLGAVAQDGLVIERPGHTPKEVQQRIEETDPDLLYLPWSSSVFLGDSNRSIPTIMDYVGPGLLEDFATHGRISAPLVQLNLESFFCGDYFITTTQRERFYLLGLLAASGRLSIGTFSRTDPLIHVIRMTPPSDPPVANAKPFERREGDLVLMLSGAFLPWYDYSILSSGIKMLGPRLKERLHVIVLGGNPRMPEEERRVRSLLSVEGVRDNITFTGIVPFSRRADYYLNADAGLVIPPDTVEDELSARTRVLDYLWARLPIIGKGRDEYTDQILNAGAGFRLDAGPASLVEVLEGLEADPGALLSAKERIDELLAGPFNGAKCAAPLLDFIESPRLTERRQRGWGGSKKLAIWMRDLARAVRSGRM